MADEASLLTVSDDEPCDEDVDSSAVDPTSSKKRKVTGAAAHRCLCCNSTGSHKIDPLVIGKAARPTAFGPKKGGWEPASVHVQYTSKKLLG